MKQGLQAKSTMQLDLSTGGGAAAPSNAETLTTQHSTTQADDDPSQSAKTLGVFTDGSKSTLLTAQKNGVVHGAQQIHSEKQKLDARPQQVTATEELGSSQDGRDSVIDRLKGSFD